MRRNNERLRAAIEAGESVKASVADGDLHYVYIRASGNIELIKILSGLKVKLRRLEVAYFGGSVIASKSVDEHEKLIEALRRGDVERAAEAVRQNWERSFDRIVARQRTHPDRALVYRR